MKTLSLIFLNKGIREAVQRALKRSPPHHLITRKLSAFRQTAVVFDAILVKTKGKEMNENSYEDYQALINANCMGNIFYIDLELSADKNFTDLCQHGVWHYNNDTSSIMIREIKEIDGNCGFSKVGIKMILSFANWTDCIQLYKIIHANNEPNWEEVNQYFIENAVKYLQY